jgi:hypothetical protein
MAQQAKIVPEIGKAELHPYSSVNTIAARKGPQDHGQRQDFAQKGGSVLPMIAHTKRAAWTGIMTISFGT